MFPRLPVRQWVLSVPKRLRYYLQREKGALNAALRIFLRVVQQSLQAGDRNFKRPFLGRLPGRARHLTRPVRALGSTAAR